MGFDLLNNLRLGGDVIGSNDAGANQIMASAFIPLFDCSRGHSSKALAPSASTPSAPRPNGEPSCPIPRAKPRSTPLLPLQSDALLRHRFLSRPPPTEPFRSMD